MIADPRLNAPRFPRSSAYHPAWVLAGVSGGANPLWLAEWLAEGMDLRPGMRVLDLGCGRALSSVFLHREFGVDVWATDLWFSAEENLQRIRDAGVDGAVVPIRADARSLPFAPASFDAIVSIDSYFYYGTDDLYLANLARFLKPGGQLGIAGVGLMREVEGAVPAHLRDWWTPDLWCLHSAPWWRRHWDRTGIVAVEIDDALEEGWRYWLEWIKAVAPDNVEEAAAVAADAGRCLGYVRCVGRRLDTPIGPPVDAVPTHYTRAPLLRDEARAAPGLAGAPRPPSTGE
jgi:SAM-dependent methyltransferase